jgi:hypothetical protein
MTSNAETGSVIKPARCLMLDDHWGGVWNECQIPGCPDHEPPHLHRLDACRPRAWLRWYDDGR